MTTAFWDYEGILLIDYLPKGTTMNGQYYVNILTQVCEAIIQKRRENCRTGLFFIKTTQHRTYCKRSLSGHNFLKNGPNRLIFFFHNLKKTQYAEDFPMTT